MGDLPENFQRSLNDHQKTNDRIIKNSKHKTDIRIGDNTHGDSLITEKSHGMAGRLAILYRQGSFTAEKPVSEFKPDKRNQVVSFNFTDSADQATFEVLNPESINEEKQRQDSINKMRLEELEKLKKQAPVPSIQETQSIEAQNLHIREQVVNEELTKKMHKRNLTRIVMQKIPNKLQQT